MKVKIVNCPCTTDYTMCVPYPVSFDVDPGRAKEFIVIRLSLGCISGRSAVLKLHNISLRTTWSEEYSRYTVSKCNLKKCKNNYNKTYKFGISDICLD